MEELIKKIEQWGYEKNIHLASPLMQTTKTFEEAIELMQGVFRYEESIYSRYYDIQCVNVMPYSEFKKNKEKHLTDIKDAIGDIFVTLVMIKIQCNSFRFSVDNAKTTKKTTKHLKTIKVITDNVYSIQKELMFNKKSHKTGFYLENITRELNKIANSYDLTLKECVEHAYNEIKDRKGEMKNGLWVKE